MDSLMTIRRIDAELIQKKLVRGERITFVDVGQMEQFHKAHIAKAVNVPLEKIPQWAKTFLGNEALQVVVYGQSDQDPRGRLAAAMMARAGFTNVSLLDGGLDLWMKLTLPSEGPLSMPGFRDRASA